MSFDANPALFDVTILYADRVLPDVVAPEDSGADTNTGPVPCTQAGQTDCVLVPCTVSFLDPGASEAGADASGLDAADAYCVSCSGSPGGVCTETEAHFVSIDIAQDAATAPGPDPDGGCYAALVKNNCLDHGINYTLLECDDLPNADLFGATAFLNASGDTVPAVATCLSVLNCITGPAGDGCSLSPQGPTDCLCGLAEEPVSTCSALPSVSSLVGNCVSQMLSGFGPPEVTDPASPNAILSDFDDTSVPSGMANSIAQCASNHSLASMAQGGKLGQFTCFP
jgi:hypothetical protein